MLTAMMLPSQGEWQGMIEISLPVGAFVPRMTLTRVISSSISRSSSLSALRKSVAPERMALSTIPLSGDGATTISSPSSSNDRKRRSNGTWEGSNGEAAKNTR
jgi:hypothetical protein